MLAPYLALAFIAGTCFGALVQAAFSRNYVRRDADVFRKDRS